MSLDNHKQTNKQWLIFVLGKKPVKQRNSKQATYQSKVKGKGKTVPFQAWAGPEGSRRLRLPDFKTVGT
jgi:hypothetical protein